MRLQLGCKQYWGDPDIGYQYTLTLSWNLFCICFGTVASDFAAGICCHVRVLFLKALKGIFGTVCKLI
jgi:hypothetical protein